MLQLKKFPDIPVSTPEEARESGPYPEEPRFRLLAREEGSFPACSGKNSRHCHRFPRGGALHTKGERNSRVVPPFPESPTYLSPFQGNLFSVHCLRHLGDSGNCGTTLEFLSPFLWRAPPLEMVRERQESFPTRQGKDSYSRTRRRKQGSSGCWRNSRASSRVETGMSGIFLSCSKGVKDPLEVPDDRCD